ncbi:MAG: [Fe-Fe] hydrogenase large subunit C-terminal domain-containing protein [Eubacteriales bacterium]|nr:[Fe-Fe] hydrogenase large subunit C-terminal domain-containing protein [Eubacteriales bacterium]
MTTFDELYKRVLEDTLKSATIQERDKYLSLHANTSQLDCLLYPEKFASVWRIGECGCSDEKQDECACACPFDAIQPNGDTGIQISAKDCVGCHICVDNCESGKLTASKDIIPALRAVRDAKGPAYALIAPAFLGQFNEDITPGKLRTALKKIGFDGMIEVSLFADILTLKEALEFSQNITTEEDFQLTSCCCPIWIAMIRKIYKDLVPHIPGSVSPMVASGRAVKLMYPDAVTVFIGPCVAKKSEAKEADVVGAIDYVLTFQEMQDVFEVMELDIASMPESEKDHSSRAGRIYARSGGVSEAVKETFKKISPKHPIEIRTERAEGVKDCKAMVNEILAGNIKANFFEGMGCVGGCVGGPKALINKEQGRENVERYGEDAAYETPIDNPYVIELLHRLGFDTVESLLENSEIFTRKF